MASSFCSDSSRLVEYDRRAGQVLGPEKCEVGVLDWPPGSPPGEAPYIEDMRGTELSHGDWTWIRSGFYLRWIDFNDFKKAAVTLIVFSASPQLRKRFERLHSNSDWEVTLVDPFSLYIIVLDELWLQAESMMNRVSGVFGSMERTALDRSLKVRTGERSDHDFVGLHNMAKHIIYLKEGSEATLLMAQRLHQHHKELLARPPQGDSSKSTMELVHQMLSQKVTQFEAWKLRMESMDKRMQNVINLSFNMVTQQDSNVMIGHSTTMKAIAAVTMFFLPATTIATIFGCGFFSTDDDKKAIVVTSDFWIFWCATVPATAAVLLLYSWWSRGSHWNLGKHRRLFHLQRGKV
ncbi:hypothetical protein MMC22_010262 [Lobaria immixta]|nr:hypothetical protein [Lobaria immixta]